MTSVDRVAVVTGASSGIGFAIARALLDEGWTVVGISRRLADLDNPQYHHLQVDLGDLRALSDVADGELAALLGDPRWGRVGLVNNAATAGQMHPIAETDPLELAQIFAVNAVAPIFLMGAVVRHTLVAIPLRIVNVSTGAAVHPFPGLSDYGSSKAALRMASMTLAAELQSGERSAGACPDAAIMSYSPGVVDTPMQVAARTSTPPWNQPFVGFHDRGMLVPPEAPAREVVRFLAGDHAEMFVERRLGAA